MTPTVSAAGFAASSPARIRNGGAAAPARAPRRAKPHLRVVDAPARRTHQSQRRLVWAAGLSVLAVLTVVVFQVLLAQSAIARDRLQQRTNAAEQRYAQARLDHAGLVAPARIEHEAQRLGLVPSEQPPTAVPVQGDLTALPRTSVSGMQSLEEVKQAVDGP